MLCVISRQDEWMATQGESSEFGLNTRQIGTRGGGGAAAARAGDGSGAGDDDDDDGRLPLAQELLRLEVIMRLPRESSFVRERASAGVSE
jgi:hypothetical protein